MGLKPAWVALVLAAVAAATWGVGQATFTASDGFSGRNGFTCTSCHVVPPPLGETATAVLEGLPAEWTPGTTYNLTIRVEGGPLALPAPAPQGGFELSTDAGTFAKPEGFEGLLRQPRPESMAYEPAGTMMREWRVLWNAPTLAEMPMEANVWLAVLAVNGNHVIATNASDGGEKYDATATLEATVPPAPEAMAAWLAMPLPPPAIESSRVSGDDWIVQGRHGDGNASRLAWSLDGAPWASRETGPEWRLVLRGLAGGEHRLELRSEGVGRTSPTAAYALQGDEAVPASEVRDSPSPLLVPALLLSLSLWRTRP